MLIVTLSCSKTESFFYEIIEPEIVTGLVVHSSYLRNQEIIFEVLDEDSLINNIRNIILNIRLALLSFLDMEKM